MAKRGPKPGSGVIPQQKFPVEFTKTELRVLGQVLPFENATLYGADRAAYRRICNRLRQAFRDAGLSAQDIGAMRYALDD
jgi:hypothetical protein